MTSLVHGAPPSFRDPARFSYAHGGKDGTPFPVDRHTCDSTIATLKRAVDSSRIGSREKLEASKSLSRFYDL